MNEIELLATINNAERDAISYTEELSIKNEKLYDAYLQRPYGDEVEDQSQVISPDIQDVVESDMPSLARIFLGVNQPVVFEPNTAGEEQEVDEKNAYVNHLIQNQPGSYEILFNWMKTAEIESHGVVKYFIEEEEKTSTQAYEGLSEGELAQVYQSLDGDKVDALDESINPDGTFNVSFRITKKNKKPRIINVPNEQFLITKGQATIDDCELVGDRITKTRGELLAEGFKRDLIDQLPALSATDRHFRHNRVYENRSDEDEVIEDWASEKVELSDLYVKVDYDGDGIAERRHILKSGNHLLINEPFDHVPYAVLSCVLMPNEVVGKSRADLTYQNQRVKTVVLRQTLDNMYMVNHPRNVVHPDVNIDDMLNVRPNGLVRMKQSTQVVPQNAIFPLITPYMGDKSMQVLQYFDHMQSKSTGTLASSQGLEVDEVNDETATRFVGVQAEGKAKIELIARTFAETGWRKLYEGIAWLVSKYQDNEAEIQVLGKPLKVNPSKWQCTHYVSTKVGTGAAEADRTIATMQTILALQGQLEMTGSPMVDQVKKYNALDEMMKSLGYKSIEQFFNNPEQPEQLMQAENEILKRKLQEAMTLLEQQQNPLSEAEQIKAQAKLIEAQGKAEMQLADMAEKSRQFDEKLASDNANKDKDLALKLTELEQKFSQELDAKLMENTLVFDPETGTFSGKL